MYRYVEWETVTKTGNDIATEFIERANLNSIDSAIIEDRRERIAQFRTAMKINRSTEFITKRIKDYLIPKYIEISKEYPDILPEIKTKKSCKYKNVTAIVSIETNDKIYSVKIANESFITFADIRLFVIEKIESKYGIKLDEINEYKTYISGGYDLIKNV